jgi:hypothetical protein
MRVGVRVTDLGAVMMPMVVTVVVMLIVFVVMLMTVPVAVVGVRPGVVLLRSVL